MGCAVDAYRASIGLLVPALLGILQTNAKKAAKRWKEQKLQSAMTVLAAITLIPGPDFEAAMDRLIDS